MRAAPETRSTVNLAMKRGFSSIFTKALVALPMAFLVSGLAHAQVSNVVGGFAGAADGGWSGGNNPPVLGPSDGSCANIGNVGSDNATSNYGFSIPGNATITDINFYVDAAAGNTDEPLRTQLAFDASSTPIAGGDLIGTFNDVTIQGLGSNCASTDVHAFFFSLADWGTDSATVTPAVVNNPNFGINFTTLVSSSIKIDSNCLEVEYTTPAGPATQVGCFTVQFTVNKDFTDNNPTPVEITLSCPGADDITANPLMASEGNPAVFAVRDNSGVATCTATETSGLPVGYNKDESDCQQGGLPADGGSCTIVNSPNTSTFTVNKDFSDDNPAPVSVTLSCTGTTSIDSANPTNAAEGAPAVFNISGFGPADTCTATEVVPVGYTGNDADCQDNDLADSGSCTIVNTLNTAQFTVVKDFTDDNADPVSVTLSCNGTTSIDSPNPANAAEGAPAIFNVSGFGPGDTCTATEVVPTGYVGNDADCQDGDTANGGTCTIVNTPTVTTFSVAKDFSDDNAAAVDVMLSCTGAEIQVTSTNPAQAAEGAPANFVVSYWEPGDTCTATEVNATLPVGYTKDESACLNVAVTDAPPASCTIVNTLNTAQFTVAKDFSDDNPAPVSVTLSCTGTTSIDSANPTNAAEGAPAVFDVSGFDPSDTCTATEVVPVGYTANEADCQDNDTVDGGSCTIVNTLNTAQFTVNKDFSDDSIAMVVVTLSCTGTTSIDSPNPQNASEASPAVFDVSGFDPADTCTATEIVPVGYTGNDADCQDNDTVDGGSCTIVNTLNSAQFTVNKDFSDDNPAPVSVTLSCTGTTSIDSANPTNAAEGAPAVFDVSGFDPADTCTATEVVPVGYTGNDADCQDNDTVDGGSCTIVNTLNTAQFTVNKDFSDDNPAPVSVTLSCTGTTSIDSANPTNAAEGAPAVFNVSGFGVSDTCTATEVVPVGYVGNDADCQDNDPADGGSCTIVNTLNASQFTVNKDFSDDNPAAVSVSLSCTGSTSIDTANPTNASEGSPAVFGISGFSPTDTCTATEVVPVGYTANEADCQDDDLADGGSCTIVNTLNTAQFTVAKDFSDDNPAPVSVTLSCTGTTSIDSANPTNAAEGAPAVFDVSGFGVSDTCTATEVVPVGYTGNDADCQDNDSADGGSCTIVNTLNQAQFTVNKDFSDDNTDPVSVTLSCTGTTSIDSANPTNAAEGAPAVFDVSGFDPADTCTATEVVPAGYTADESDCLDNDTVDGGSCTIVNTLNRATFTVNKDFADDDPGSVSVTAVCSSGTVTNNPQSASEAVPASFAVEGFEDGATCTATEVVPAGYLADESDCQDNDPVDGSCTIVNTPNNPDIEVIKVGQLDTGDDGQASPGDIVTFTFTVTNTGDVQLLNILVDDPFPGLSPIDCAPEANPIVDMDPLEEVVCTATYAITQDDIENGTINNTVTVTADCDGDPMCATDDDELDEVIPQEGDGGLDKVGTLDLGADGIATPGDLITYTLTVTNGGNVNLTNVQVTDPLLPTITCPSGNPIPLIAPGDSEVCTGTYAITQDDIDAGLRDNTATAVGDCVDVEVCPITREDDHLVLIGQEGGLQITKDADPDSYSQVGDIITYTFTVENTGNVTLTNVGVTDPLITDPPNSGTISCAGESNPIADLAPGEVVVCTGTYTITADDVAAGQVVNSAAVTGECPAQPGEFEGDGQVNCPPTDEDDEVIEHDPGPTSFRVQKDFSDDNPMNVLVSITCNTGLPLYQEADLSEFGNPFDFIEFIVDDFLPGTMDCSIEELVPAGYEPTYTAGSTTGVAGSIFSDDDGCHYEEIEGGQFTCDIFNDLQPVEVVVEKEWIDENPGYQLPTQVDVTLYCSEPIQGGFPCLLGGNVDQASGALYCSEQYIDPNNPGVWTVFPHYEGTDCWATEEPIAGVITDESDCEELTLFPGEGDSCLIVNTRIYAGIPTLSQYGLILMALLMLGFGAVAYRRFI